MIIHRAAPPGEIVIRHLNEMLDVRGIPADEIALDLVNMRRYLRIPIRLRIALPPAVYPLIRVYLHKAQVLRPPRMNQVVLNIGNLHYERSGLKLSVMY